MECAVYAPRPSDTGSVFAMLPPHDGEPAPTLLLFAMAGPATLTTEPYCRVGRLLCLMRTGSAACPIYEAHSDDQGLTWSKPCPTRAVGVDPCLLELSDGRLAFSWGTRLWDNSGRRTNPPGQAPTFKLCLSSDGGQHWTEPLEIPQVSPSTGIGSNTGYSALAELEPGHLLMAYDVGSFGDKRHLIAVRDVIIEPLTGGPITSNNLQRSQEINFQHCCNSNRNT